MLTSYLPERFSQMLSLALAVVVLASQCPAEQPHSHLRIKSCGPDANVVRQLPGVASVTVSQASKGTTHRIIQIRNWHFVNKADFSADLQSIEKKPLPNKVLESRYQHFLAEIEAVQAEQRKLLDRLIQQHGLQRVFIEGLTKEARPAFQKRLESLRRFKKHKPKGETPVEQFLLHMNRLDLLEIGAAGQLCIQGTLSEVLPAEESVAFKQANPVGENGKVTFDEKRNAIREDAIVRGLLKGGPVAVVILGGGHDLTDNAERISGGTCEVITVTTKAYRSVAE